MEIGSTFGDDLRSERERRRTSLEALCGETKVKLLHLDALERGDYKALPGGVFRRGIVRAYLLALGLDEREWMPRFQDSYDRFLRSTGAASEEKTDAWTTFALNVKKNRGTASHPTTLRWLGVALLLALLIAAFWAVDRYLLHGALRG